MAKPPSTDRKRERSDDDDKAVIRQLAVREEDDNETTTQKIMKLQEQRDDARGDRPAVANGNPRSGLKLGIVRLGRAGGKVIYRNDILGRVDDYISNNFAANNCCSYHNFFKLVPDFLDTIL